MATIKVKVDVVGLDDPKWSVAAAKPGEEVELSVKTKPLKAGQSVEFRIRDETGGLIDVLKASAAGDRQTATWVAPSAPGTLKLKFDAVLREPPSPKNGHVTSRGLVSSDVLNVVGYKVSITSADEAFAPHAEALRVVYRVENEGGLPLKGRFEVWGERYPGGKPLYIRDFTPASGTETRSWGSWKGKANAGVLEGKFITPEFSPYRVKVVVGVDDASVKDPMGGGRGKVCVAECHFDVAVQSIVLRLKETLTSATRADLQELLKIEHKSVRSDGTFAAEGRLPRPDERCRIRIPCATHTRPGDALGSGGDLVANPYMDKGQPTKWSRDATIHTRPEIPLEFEPRLRSRFPSKNTKDGGVFDADAIGPLKIEPFVDDVYQKALYAGTDPVPTYLRNAVHKVKRGTHSAPVNDGWVHPIIGYWQARREIATDGEREINLADLDHDFQYMPGKGELTVYLNRARLIVGKENGVDVEEINMLQLRLRPGLAKKGDVLWIVRDDSSAPAAHRIANWSKFIPSANCHDHYGGIRGAAPNVLFRDDFSVTPVAPKQPILGAGSPWPYKPGINLDPDQGKGDQERVEVMALASGAEQGLAGIIFSPSYIAGDSYALGVQLAPFPYERGVGALPNVPRCRTTTGVLSVWRVMTISKSLRMPGIGTPGLRPGVGGPSDPPVVASLDQPARLHQGDGIHMMISSMNAELADIFNEWTIPSETLRETEFHTDIDLDAYIAAHDSVVLEGNFAEYKKGLVKIGTKDRISNQFVQFDPYRAFLPPGAESTKAIDKLISEAPPGTPSVEIMNKITPAMLTGRRGKTRVSFNSEKTYRRNVEGIVLHIAEQIVGELARAASTADPVVKTMSVIRWPSLYEAGFWFNGTPKAVGKPYDDSSRSNSTPLGFAAGGGISFFQTAGDSEIAFSHEMGHSLHLTHFAGPDFEWKHHDLLFPECKMSYAGGSGYIPKPDTTVGPFDSTTPVDQGWPDTVPKIIPDGAREPTTPPAYAGEPTIEIGTNTTGRFCAKCALKLRGWKDDLLPCAWRHPDLF